MKKITYLLVTMLMALTMVGCQVDLSDYLTKEEAEKTYATKTELAEAVKDLKADIKSINDSLENYATKEELKGYATKESVEALGDISSAVSTYLATVDFSEYITEGYTKEEVNAKIKAITDITDKLGDVDTLLATISGLSTKVTSLETTVANIEAEGLTDTQIAQIKADLQTWCNENLNGATVDLTNYVTKTDLASYVKSETLDAYAKKSDYVSTTTFNAKVSVIESRITEVEKLVTRVATLESKVTTLEADMLTKANTSALTSLETTVGNLRSEYNDTKATVNGIDLTNYLTIENLNGYATTSYVDTKVGEVVTELGKLDKRVDALETILGVKGANETTVNKVKLAIASIDTTNENVATLRSELNTLKNTVTNETDGLVKRIGDANTSIELLNGRVTTLEGVEVAYKTYCDNAINGLADIYAKKDLSNTNVTSDDVKQTIYNIIESYIVSDIKDNTTNVGKAIADTYATKTSVENKLDASSKTITDITEAISSKADAITMDVISSGKGFWKLYIKLSNSCYLISSKSIEQNDKPSINYFISLGNDQWEVVSSI